MHPHPPIPIQPESPAAAPSLASESRSACGRCLAAEVQPVCRSARGQPCAAATLRGPAEELRRVLTALGERLGFAPEAPELAGISGLSILPGEVELQLSLPANCGGAAVHETAFDVMRSLLPDTDIYIKHV